MNYRPDQVSIDSMDRSNQFYTPDEDLIIIRAKEVDILTWAEISQLLPGRTAQAIKRRYLDRLVNRQQT
jgi:hypothetical protein